MGDSYLSVSQKHACHMPNLLDSTLAAVSIISWIYPAVQRQTVVTAFLKKSKLLLLFSLHCSTE